MYTTIYTSAVDGMQKEFEVPPTIIVLGLTTNLFGIAFGSVLLSSVSEIYGRRPLYLISVFLFGVFILLVALAQNVETILISRFFAGVFAGSIMSNSPGSVTDVTDDRYRALAISCWSLGAMNGSVLGMFRVVLIIIYTLMLMIQSFRGYYRWFCLPVSWLALDKLACPNLFWCQLSFDRFGQGDLYTKHSSEANQEDTRGDR